MARRGAVVVVVGHKVTKLKVAAVTAHPVRFGRCGTRSQLSDAHNIVSKLVRSGEIWTGDVSDGCIFKLETRLFRPLRGPGDHRSVWAGIWGLSNQMMK